MNEWKPDRSGQFLTVVYKDVVPGDEVGALHEHPKACAMSWSNALHDVDYLRNRLPAQKPLTFEQVEDCFPEGAIFAEPDGWLRVSAQTLHDIARNIEAAHGIKE